MTPVEALQLALSKEKASIKLYETLAGQHPAIKELLYSLMSEEEKHLKMIDKRMQELMRL
jgi:rubrerythrin